MTILYSAETGGFYDTEIHGNALPKDALIVETAAYEELFLGQAAGKLIQADSSGHPILVDRPVLSIDLQRKSRMASCQAEISLLESDQHRAVRELLTAMLGGAAPAEALKTEAGQKLQQVETQIVRLRDTLGRIAKAHTMAELDAVAI